MPGKANFFAANHPAGSADEVRGFETINAA
jgi:hypothetical protein